MKKRGIEESERGDQDERHKERTTGEGGRDEGERTDARDKLCLFVFL